LFGWVGEELVDYIGKGPIGQLYTNWATPERHQSNAMPYPSHPSYAILSHIWGREDEEIIFKDLINGSGGNKKGC
jgi:hypothetical protein